MPTKTYAQLFALIQALCGVTFTSIELNRIKALINRRAFYAYRASNFWPRFLVIGEERTINNDLVSVPVVPYEDTNLDTIDTFMRIHKTAPYQSRSAQEFDYYVGPFGAQLIAGSLNPETVFVTYKRENTNQYGDSSGETNVIPLEWFQYLAHGTYADYLRSEGQQEKAVGADQEAELLLNEELIRIDNQHTTGVVGTKISTNSNYQMR